MDEPRWHWRCLACGEWGSGRSWYVDETSDTHVLENSGHEVRVWPRGAKHLGRMKVRITYGA